MNYYPYIVLFCLSLFLTVKPALSSSGVPQVDGLSLEEVVAVIGEEPVGVVETPRAKIVYFRLGEVRFVDDIVEQANLITPEQLLTREARDKVHRAEALERIERLRLQRIEDGENLRQQRSQSAAFLTLSGIEQVRFWRQFQATYPEVDVSAELQHALALHQSEAAELQRQAEINALRQRLEMAENAASRAAIEAERARAEAARANARRNSQWWHTGYHSRPVIVVPQSRNPIHITPPKQPTCPESANPSVPNQGSQPTVNRQFPQVRSSVGSVHTQITPAGRL